MPDKPTTVPVLDSNQTNRVAPAAAKIADGYVLNDTFPASNANYLHGWAGDWFGWLDATFADGPTADSIALPNLDDTLPAGDALRDFGSTTQRWGTGHFQTLGVGGGHTPQSPVHIHSGDFSATPSDGPRAESLLTLEDDAWVYLSFLTPNDARAGLIFGDPEDNDAGALVYDHDNQRFLHVVEGTTELVVNNTALGPFASLGLDLGTAAAPFGVTYTNKVAVGPRNDSDLFRVTRDTAATTGVVGAGSFRAQTQGVSYAAFFGGAVDLRTETNDAAISHINAAIQWDSISGSGSGGGRLFLCSNTGSGVDKRIAVDETGALRPVTGSTYNLGLNTLRWLNIFSIRADLGDLVIGNSGATPIANLDVVGEDGAGEGAPTLSNEDVAVFRNNENAFISAYIAVTSGTSGNAGLLLGDKDDKDRGALLYNNSTDVLSFRTAASNRMWLDGTGLFGIGLVPVSARGLLQLNLASTTLGFVNASTTGTPSTAAGWIEVNMAGTTRWIQCYSTAP